MNAKVKEKNLSTETPSLVTKFADRYNVEPDKMLTTLKATAFKQKKGSPEVSTEQMMALLIVADQYGLNPFTKEIYAYPDKNKGIIPVVGVDGWSRIMNGHKEYDGINFMPSSETVTMKGSKECPVAMQCIIHRKDRSHPTIITEFMDECYREPFKGKDGYITNGPWQSHPKRLLRHKAMIQCARIAFSFVGIYDEDEAERIIDGVTFDGETTVHESEGIKVLNKSILNGSDKKSHAEEPKPKQEPKTKSKPKSEEQVEPNKIDLIARIKVAGKNDLLELEALILDLEPDDWRDCKDEIQKRKSELGPDKDKNNPPY